MKITSLPDDMIIQIVQFMRFWDVFSLNGTCRDLYRMTSLVKDLPSISYDSNNNNNNSHIIISKLFRNELHIAIHQNLKFLLDEEVKRNKAAQENNTWVLLRSRHARISRVYNSLLYIVSSSDTNTAHFGAFLKIYCREITTIYLIPTLLRCICFSRSRSRPTIEFLYEFLNTKVSTMLFDDYTGVLQPCLKVLGTQRTADIFTQRIAKGINTCTLLVSLASYCAHVGRSSADSEVTRLVFKWFLDTFKKLKTLFPKHMYLTLPDFSKCKNGDMLDNLFAALLHFADTSNFCDQLFPLLLEESGELREIEYEKEQQQLEQQKLQHQMFLVAAESFDKELARTVLHSTILFKIMSTFHYYNGGPEKIIFVIENYGKQLGNASSIASKKKIEQEFDKTFKQVEEMSMRAFKKSVLGYCICAGYQASKQLFKIIELLKQYAPQVLKSIEHDAYKYMSWYGIYNTWYDKRSDAEKKKPEFVQQEAVMNYLLENGYCTFDATAIFAMTRSSNGAFEALRKRNQSKWCKIKGYDECFVNK